MPLSNNSIKHIRSLRLKKFRQQHQNFVVEGDKIVRELLEHRPEWLVSLYALPEWLQAQAGLLPTHPPAEAVSAAELGRASLLATPNKALAVARIPTTDWREAPIGQGLCLYLDGLQDPGNMGTLLRLADWFGIPTVLCSPNCVDAYNPKVIQASMGAFLRVQVAEALLPEVQQRFPSLMIYGADLEGENVFQTALSPTALLVVGNEGAGLSETAAACLTQRLFIPRGPGGKAESLNVAVATGIICGLMLNKR